MEDRENRRVSQALGPLRPFKRVTFTAHHWLSGSFDTRYCFNGGTLGGRVATGGRKPYVRDRTIASTLAQSWYHGRPARPAAAL